MAHPSSKYAQNGSKIAGPQNKNSNSIIWANKRPRKDEPMQKGYTSAPAAQKKGPSIVVVNPKNVGDVTTPHTVSLQPARAKSPLILNLRDGIKTYMDIKQVSSNHFVFNDSNEGKMVPSTSSSGTAATLKILLVPPNSPMEGVTGGHKEVSENQLSCQVDKDVSLNDAMQTGST